MDRLVKANWVQSWLTRCSSRSCTLALQPSELRSPQVGEQVTPYIFTACSPCKVHWSQGAEASRPFVADTAVEASESEANDLSDLRSQLLLHEGVFFVYRDGVLSHGWTVAEPGSLGKLLDIHGELDSICGCLRAEVVQASLQAWRRQRPGATSTRSLPGLPSLAASRGSAWRRAWQWSHPSCGCSETAIGQCRRRGHQPCPAQPSA